MDKKNQLDVTFCILYFCSNSCSTCFGQPCAHHQELTTAWCYSLVLVCTVTTFSVDKKNQLDVTFCILCFSSTSCSACFVAMNPSMDALPANRTWQPSCSHGTYQHEAITSRSRQLLMMGTLLPETCWPTSRREIKNTKVTSSWFFLSTLNFRSAFVVMFYFGKHYGILFN